MTRGDDNSTRGHDLANLPKGNDDKRGRWRGVTTATLAINREGAITLHPPTANSGAADMERRTLGSSQRALQLRRCTVRGERAGKGEGMGGLPLERVGLGGSSRGQACGK